MKEVDKNWPRIDDLEARCNKTEGDLREFYKVLIGLEESSQKTTSELEIWKKGNE